MHQCVKAQKGGALLTALFIMTLVAIVATAMSMRLQLDIYRTRLITTHDQLYLAAQVVSFWSMNELADQNREFYRADEKGMIARFPHRMEGLYKGVRVSGELYDLQSRFNINNFSDKRGMPSFIALQKNTAAESNANLSKDIALALIDWLSDYTLDKGKDNYTAYYLAQKPPYFPSHLLMHSASELRLVKGVSAEFYQHLEPYITAIPGVNPINLNTAPKIVLQSLGGGLPDHRVEELMNARGSEGIKKMSDISEILKKMNLSNEQVTIQSQYFLSIAHVTRDDFHLNVYTIYKRSRDNKNKAFVGIIRESINSFN